MDSEKAGTPAPNPPRWLEWAREIQALSQTGYHYAENEYQRQRNRRLSEIAAEIISEHTRLAFTPLSQIFQAQIGYATPRVDVRGAVFQEGKLLLVRERQDGGWTMPGGWADVGDVPSEAAEREVWEEAGFRVKARKLVGVYDANRLEPLELFHAFKLVFLCELIEGAPRPAQRPARWLSSRSIHSPAFCPASAPGRATSWMRSRPLQDPDCATVFD